MKRTRESILTTVNLVLRLLALLAVVYFVSRCIDAPDDDDIDIEPTPVVIESIKPIGQLYALTAITEDFTIDEIETVGFFSRNYHKAVQTLRMQVSFVIDLDSVQYLPVEDTDTVVVRLPQPRFVQSAQGGMLLCEVETDNYDARRAISIVEQKIRSKYDTPQARAKALAHAREVLSAFVQQCGLVPRFEEMK